MRRRRSSASAVPPARAFDAEVHPQPRRGWNSVWATFTLWGAPVSVHWSVFVGMLLSMAPFQDSTVDQALMAMLHFVSVLLHEYGHFASFRYFGVTRCSVSSGCLPRCWSPGTCDTARALRPAQCTSSAASRVLMIPAKWKSWRSSMAREPSFTSLDPLSTRCVSCARLL